MGATVMAGAGTAFRVWAPRASAVYVVGAFNNWQRDGDSLLNPAGGGHWAGFLPEVFDGAGYKFYVIGPGGEGFKRDPHARELTFDPPFPFCNCVVNDPEQFPWHDAGFRPPAFHELIIYQFHTGTFFIPDGHSHGRFLDVVERLPYLVSLGVNAIQPLPIQEFPSEFSLGYNGTDYFSPEGDYGVSDSGELAKYVERINVMLTERGLAPYAPADLVTSADQLRALIDLSHVHGMAVILDVVYNHAGGGFDSDSIYFFDQMPQGNQNDSLYFTDREWAGGLGFAYWNQDVRQFLIDNTGYFLREFHVDGFRYDEVSVIDHFGGWSFCRDLADTNRFVKPEAIQIAEYWPVNPVVVQSTQAGGAGFDATWNDGLRDAVRALLGQAAGGAGAFVDMERLAGAIETPGFMDHWRSVQCVENHDIVREGREARVARLADATDARSWYARSRSRVAAGVLLTAPGIPMLFMGQEFLEDKQWSDYPGGGHDLYWDGLAREDRAMVDMLRFTRDLAHLKRALPGLRAPSVHVFHVNGPGRVVAFHRWEEGLGHDVVVVVSLNESTFYGYQLGFPGGGWWREVFNSDVYDHWVNPWVAGNGGGIDANGGSLHGLPASAAIVIPANSILVFAR